MENSDEAAGFEAPNSAKSQLPGEAAHPALSEWNFYHLPYLNGIFITFSKNV